MSAGVTNISNIEKYILDITYELSNRLYDFDNIILNDMTLNSDSKTLLSFAQGTSGLCVLYGELDLLYPNNGWDEKGHKILLRTLEQFEKNGIDNLSAFSGLTGLCFSILALSKGGTRYKNLFTKLNDIFFYSMEKYLLDLKVNINFDKGINNYLFDVCYGLSGIGGYLLHIKNMDSRSEDLIIDILEIMVQMSSDIIINNEKVPGWFTPSSYNENFDIGFFDTGLAHGICGPLSLLSISYLKGYCVKGQIKAINKIVDWLSIKVTENGMRIPNIISFDNETKKIRDNFSTRDAWCYGLPGISRAIFWGGKALSNSEVIDFSKELFFLLTKRSFEEQLNFSPTFCHGLSGLLYITNIMNNEFNDDEFCDYQIKIAWEIIGYYNEKLPFGFQDYNIREGKLFSENKIGILEGTIGVLLALLAYIKKECKTGWDKLFLLN
ncbi:lanthionine synthetase C family protein [Bacillus sp. APMAM]|nr:lanthionine synthetase C family protein [Bacillus sp. APMAM]